MFWLLPIFAFVLQLPATYSSFFCIQCSLSLNLSSSDVINTTNCYANSNSSSPLCTSVLKISYESNSANVTFMNDSRNFTNVLNGKNVIKHDMTIGLDDNKVYREIQVSCFNNNSCSEDMKKIYDKSKKLNYTVLQNDLKNQLYNSSSPVDQLTCANNEDQEIPCPDGCCELMSNGKFGFNHKCTACDSTGGHKVIIEQHVIGETDAESSFTYTCNKHMCNDKTNAEKVRDLLKNSWLLTPLGVGPDPPNTAVTMSSKTSIVIQCILMVVITSFFKYN